MYFTTEMVEEASYDSGEEQDTMSDANDQFRNKKKFGRRQSTKSNSDMSR